MGFPMFTTFTAVVTFMAVTFRGISLPFAPAVCRAVVVAAGVVSARRVQVEFLTGHSLVIYSTLF
jgi:hypothetical protein